MSSHRLFYDPKNPRLLSDKDIQQLSPAECDAACLQIDQILVSVLQGIDAEFGRSHRTVTQKLLPEVERYGEASRKIWEGIKFWQHFFEASAKVSLSGYDNVSDSASFTTESVANDTQMTDAAHGDSSKPEGASPEDSDITERNAHPKFLESSPSLKPPLSDVTHQSGSTATLRRPPDWHDLSLDSPDTTLQMPSARDVSLVLNNSGSNSLASGISDSPFLTNIPPEQSTLPDGSPAPRRKSTGQGSMLLHQLMMKNMIGTHHPRPTISTPMKPNALRTDRQTSRLILPQEVSHNWDGMTDLRTTTLDGFVSPSKKSKSQPRVSNILSKGKSRNVDEDDSVMAGLSPPQTIHFSVPRSKLARTPAKEAARLVTRDVLETARFRAGYANPSDLEDSPPIEPPSVLRDWNARGYEDILRKQPNTEGNRRGFEEENDIFSPGKSDEGTLRKSHHDTHVASLIRPSESRDVSSALIDLREGDTNLILGQGPYDHLEDRDDPTRKRPLHDSSDEERGPLTGTKRIASSPRQSSYQGNQLNQLPISPSEDGTGSPPESPTFFGVRHEPSPESRNSRPSGSSQPQTAQHSRAHVGLEKAAPVQTFVPLKPDEINTFFGGNLLESECFEPSPLQNRRSKKSDPQ